MSPPSQPYPLAGDLRAFQNTDIFFCCDSPVKVPSTTFYLLIRDNSYVTKESREPSQNAGWTIWQCEYDYDEDWVNVNCVASQRKNDKMTMNGEVKEFWSETTSLLPDKLLLMRDEYPTESGMVVEYEWEYPESYLENVKDDLDGLDKAYPNELYPSIDITIHLVAVCMKPNHQQQIAEKYPDVPAPIYIDRFRKKGEGYIPDTIKAIKKKGSVPKEELPESKTAKEKQKQLDQQETKKFNDIIDRAITFGFNEFEDEYKSPANEAEALDAACGVARTKLKRLHEKAFGDEYDEEYKKSSWSKAEQEVSSLLEARINKFLRAKRSVAKPEVVELLSDDEEKKTRKPVEKDLDFLRSPSVAVEKTEKTAEETIADFFDHEPDKAVAMGLVRLGGIDER